MEKISITYLFTLGNGTRELFDIELDAEKLTLTAGQPPSLPAWAKLEFHQCDNCLLTARQHPYCPVAASIVDIVNRFDGILSYDIVHLEVTTTERKVSQTIAAQRAISSLLGLVIAASGCPRTAFLRPMARFHLPMANEAETVYRATSMYLLAQYVLTKRGRSAEQDLAGLKKRYDNLQELNAKMIRRLRTIATTDSTLNAIIALDVYAQCLPRAVEKSLRDLHYLFMPFLESTDEGS